MTGVWTLGNDFFLREQKKFRRLLLALHSLCIRTLDIIGCFLRTLLFASAHRKRRISCLDSARPSFFWCLRREQVNTGVGMGWFLLENHTLGNIQVEDRLVRIPSIGSLAVDEEETERIRRSSSLLFTIDLFASGSRMKRDPTESWHDIHHPFTTPTHLISFVSLRGRGVVCMCDRLGYLEYTPTIVGNIVSLILNS